VADASHVGTVIDEVDMPVEPGKVREFAIAVGDEDQDSVPLTFAAVASHWRDQAAMVAMLGLDIRRVVVGASEWEYGAPVLVGDRLAGRRIVTDVVVKAGGQTIITLETALHRGDGELAVTQRDTVIELAP
jgi:MaoC dehydratase-like protein